MSSTMLELAISMIFLYLMLSAASSAIQEIIANLWHWRAKTLEKGIEGLLSKQFKDEFYKLPLIESLCSPNTSGEFANRPSYIAPATFALAVLDLAARKGMNLAAGPVIPPPAPGPGIDGFAKPTAILQSLLVGANDVDEQRKRIETWFNDSMDRVSGWYKRKSHAWLWIIGIVLCVVVNADSISLANLFWNDPTLRAATVAAATEHVKKNKEGSGTGSSGPAQGTAESGDSTTKKDPFKDLNEVKSELAQADIPLGWCWKSANSEKKCFPVFAGAADNSAVDSKRTDPRMVMCSRNSTDIVLWWFWKIIGLTVTGLAISQGAPFWFDLLQKAVNLRLAGDAPDEKGQKGTK